MRILELTIRNLKETYRDPLALGFLLGFPLVFMLLFGAIFSGDDVSSYPVGVVDDDRSQLSETFSGDVLAAVPMFEIETYDDAGVALEDLKLGELKAFIVIPSGFGDSVYKNWQGEEKDISIDLTYDESDYMLSEQLISIVNSVTRSFAKIEIPVKVNSNPIYIEEDTSYIDFMGPGIIVFGILILIPTSARIMVHDKEKGFLARLLTTPTRPAEFILGYSLCLAVIAIAQVALFMLAAWGYGMNIVGSVWLAFLVFFLTSLCSIGIGMVVASLSKSENQAEPLCWLFSMPLAMLSGCWFSIEMLPKYLHTVANLFPYAHTIEAARGVLIRGSGLVAVGSELIFLAAWAVVVFGLGVLLFRRSMRA